MLMDWFKTGFVHDIKGTKLDNMEVSKKHKHTIVQRIWGSEKISLETKEELMAKLAGIDSSDWLTNTKKVCEAAHPGNKEKMWKLYFSKDSELEEWGLCHYQNSFRGWNQVQQRAHTEQLQGEFFDKISDIIASKGRYVAESYYYALKPTLHCDDAAIKRYQDLLDKVLKDQPDNTMFIKLLKSTIGDLHVQAKGREASRQYLQENQ